MRECGFICTAVFDQQLLSSMYRNFTESQTNKQTQTYRLMNTQNGYSMPSMYALRQKYNACILATPTTT